AQALSTIFGTEAMTGMLSLIEAGPDKFRALTTELQNSAGSSATAAAQMKDNLAGSMEELSGAVETLQISFGSALAPAIRAVADALAGVVNWFNQLSPATQKFIAIGAALTAGLLVLTGVVGFLVAGLGMLAAAQWAVILPIAAWVGAITGAIVVVGILAAVIIQNWDE
ncbi:phage tail tape measure protein, partial [Corallococcus carmarthensis]|uniref:phage tail tape measure protein n=1 Tax=Corallococcus carmarthensis TaxID=2316728 RepID=UPI00148BFF64